MGLLRASAWGEVGKRLQTSEARWGNNSKRTNTVIRLNYTINIVIQLRYYQSKYTRAQNKNHAETTQDMEHYVLE